MQTFCARFSKSGAAWHSAAGWWNRQICDDGWSRCGQTPMRLCSVKLILLNAYLKLLWTPYGDGAICETYGYGRDIICMAAFCWYCNSHI
jgi:hypothetical protein